MMGAVEAVGRLGAEGPDFDAPLVVRRSHLLVLAGLGVVGVCAGLSLAFVPQGLKGQATVLVTIFLAVCTVVGLIELLDRRPRLILERNGLHWRWRFGIPVWTAWRDVRSARLRSSGRRGVSWLMLTLASESGDTHEVSIKLDRTTLDGDEVRTAIRLRAPHLFAHADD